MQWWANNLCFATGMIFETISALSTVVLVIITAYYAYTTHKLLKHQKEIFQVETRPYLNNEGFIVEPYWKNNKLRNMRVGVKLKNVSRVLIYYKVVNVSIRINNYNVDSATLVNEAGYVYPEQAVDFSVGSQTVIPNLNNSDRSKTVLLIGFKYEIEYSSTSEEKYRSIRHYNIYYLKGGRIEHKIISQKELQSHKVK